ncbi:ABC transporter ATP-binding protein [Corynebacterium sp. HMSC064E10]|uniref:ABC-F family ATP-binding cassette domain-containing protein n=1 Tax=Corynebacterium sp. HMSC064E10 TaxID=1739364 RepID=UPI0008A2636F|nr:ABC-F family ATP-binding cassette domain-containing protein [Corynebacterium sp. HMSC064E10]OFR94369.1 ABC transporter ATP-binding protein [Corynebacterium sp. HMSC064E10]
MSTSHSPTTDLSNNATQLVANGVNFDYEATPVLRDVSLTLSDGDVLGLVGDNGAGKSTLLWLLSGRRRPTSGTVTHIGTRVLGSQELEAPFDSTVQMLIDEALGPSKRRLAELEEAAEAMSLAETPDESEAAEKAYSKVFSDVMAHDDWNAEHNAEIVLDHLGLTGTAPDGVPLVEQLTTEISGGQRARLGLAITLIRKPEILLLDEPTNHLDERGRQLVIDTIQNHPGVVVVATHDRDFLDAVCTVIGDLVPGRPGIGLFRGNYSDYAKHRRHQRELWEHQWRSEEHERNRLEDTIDNGAREVSPGRAMTDNNKMAYDRRGGRVERQIARRVRSAKQRLDELIEEGVERPPALLGFDAPLTAPLPTKRAASGSDEDFHIKMRGVVVPDRIRVGSLTIRPGDKVVITGPNGAGKSTLFKAIMGQVETQAGEVRIGENCRVAMLAQEQDWETPKKSARELYDLAPNARVPLDDFGLLSPEDANRPVGNLSIGQQRRVALALVVANPPEILLLDEPTNHLSVDLIEQVQDAIASAEGTIIVITHDHRMINSLEARHLQVADGEVVELPKGQKPVEFA